MMNDADLREKLYFIQKSCGAVPGPHGLFFGIKRNKNLACTHESDIVKMEKKLHTGFAIILKLQKFTGRVLKTVPDMLLQKNKCVVLVV